MLNCHSSPPPPPVFIVLGLVKPTLGKAFTFTKLSSSFYHCYVMKCSDCQVHCSSKLILRTVVATVHETCPILPSCHSLTVHEIVGFSYTWSINTGGHGSSHDVILGNSILSHTLTILA